MQRRVWTCDHKPCSERVEQPADSDLLPEDWFTVTVHEGSDATRRRRTKHFCGRNCAVAFLVDEKNEIGDA